MNQNTIAVLPFKNISSDKQNEFFSDGITEEIINALSKIDSLHVISRTSSFFFKDKNLPLKQISEELNANILLEGSTRVFGEQVRISATLIDAKNDTSFWSESWDRKMENIFEIQDEVSLRIAENIREQFGHFEITEHLVEKQTENLDAYQYALKARYHFNKWNPEDVQKSINLYEKALALDSEHVESVIGLADSYSFMATTQFMPRETAWAKSVEYTQKAFKMDPNNAAVHYLMANLSFFGDCNYAESLQLNSKSIALKPNYPEAQQFMAFLYMLKDNMEEAQ
jgi:TolB-like protein